VRAEIGEVAHLAQHGEEASLKKALELPEAPSFLQHEDLRAAANAEDTMQEVLLKSAPAQEQVRTGP